MSFGCLQILPKKERKQVNLRYHSKVNFFRSFFGRIEDTKKTFRNQLTFRCVSVSKIKGIKKSRGGFIRSSPFLLQNGRGNDMKSSIS